VALEAVKKSSGQKINDATFRSTYYKLKSGSGGKRVVRRKRPLRGGAGRGHDVGGGVVGAALAFIRAAGSIEQAKQVLADLEEFREL
jgi:hypothetical protein